MSRLSKSLFVSLLVLNFSYQVFAVLIGKGEVKGEVMSSWMSGEKVGFRLSISSQTNWSGPRLGNPNNFVYNGADKMKLTEGDRVSLAYNSSDGSYIVAERLEFVEDKASEIDQTSYLLPVISVLGAAAVVFAVIYLIGRKRRALRPE